jgi:Fe-S oxidoreductase
MAKQCRFEAERKMAAAKLACGRDFGEQIEAINKYGNHGVSPVLRAGVLAAHGIRNPKDKADVAVFFGCYRPFTTPFLLRDYLRLLDILGVDYTFFKREYCCGLPLVMQSDQGELADNRLAGYEFNQRNLALARDKGASSMAYCCMGCVYAAKYHFREEQGEHAYMLDVICNALDGKILRIAPLTVGYFGGCQTFYNSVFPGVTLDWARYRRELARIEGLKIVDLSSSRCCKHAADMIVDQAWKQNLDTIVTPCNGCYAALKLAANNKVGLLTVPEILLRAFGYEAPRGV